VPPTAYAGGIVVAGVTGAPDHDTNRSWLVYILVESAAAPVGRLFPGRGPVKRSVTWIFRRAAERGVPVESRRSMRRADAD
jgi:hypothetical protein